MENTVELRSAEDLTEELLQLRSALHASDDYHEQLRKRNAELDQRCQELEIDIWAYRLALAAVQKELKVQ